jgi:hypothetical protein
LNSFGASNGSSYKNLSLSSSNLLSSALLIAFFFSSSAISYSLLAFASLRAFNMPGLVLSWES